MNKILLYFKYVLFLKKTNFIWSAITFDFYTRLYQTNQCCLKNFERTSNTLIITLKQVKFGVKSKIELTCNEHFIYQFIKISENNALYLCHQMLKQYKALYQLIFTLSFNIEKSVLEQFRNTLLHRGRFQM